MKGLEFEEWLKGENKFATDGDNDEVMRRLKFLAQEVFYNKQNHIKSYNAMEIFSKRQDIQGKSLSKLANVLQKLSEIIDIKGIS